MTKARAGIVVKQQVRADSFLSTEVHLGGLPSTAADSGQMDASPLSRRIQISVNVQYIDVVLYIGVKRIQNQHAGTNSYTILMHRLLG